MKGIYFSQTPIEQESEQTYACSKFLGCPTFPQNFLIDADGECILSESDYFIMQVNLQDIAHRQSLLPNEGMLYFFIDVDTYEPKVLYASDLQTGPLEVYDDINDAFSADFGITQGYRLVFDESLQEGHYLAGDINPDLDIYADTDTEGYITLLEIDFLALPREDMLTFGYLAPLGGHYVFLIKEEELMELDFSNVKFVEKET